MNIIKFERENEKTIEANHKLMLSLIHFKG